MGALFVACNRDVVGNLELVGEADQRHLPWAEG